MITPKHIANIKIIEEMDYTRDEMTIYKCVCQCGDISYRTIRELRQRAGKIACKSCKNIRRINRNNVSNISEKIKLIFSLRSDGYTMQEIGNKTGTTRQYISKVLKKYENVVYHDKLT